MSEEKWYAELPEDLHPQVEKFDTVEDLAKGYANAESMIGSSVRIPSEDAEAGQWDQFKEKLRDVPGITMMPNGDDEQGWSDLYSTLGRPGESSAYEIDDAGFAELAHANNLTTNQARNLYEAYMGAENQKNEQRQIELQGLMESLKEEWGAAYEQNGRRAQQAVEYLDKKIKAGGELTRALHEPGMGDHPLLIKALSAIGEMLGEKQVAATDTSNVFGIAPGEARDRAMAIIGDLKDAYHDAAHPNHQSRIDHVRRLMEIAHPE